jgi:hypothetical protein
MPCSTRVLDDALGSAKIFQKIGMPLQTCLVCKEPIILKIDRYAYQTIVVEDLWSFLRRKSRYILCWVLFFERLGKMTVLSLF